MTYIYLSSAYFLACLLLGYFGRNKKLGFWGYFFGSIIFTPTIGALLVIASDSKK